MLDSSIFKADLGSLSYLPREIRDRIYSLSLNYNLDREKDCCAHGCPRANCFTNTFKPQTSLFRTSKRIYTESAICFFQTNEICLNIDYEELESAKNRSVTGQPGFALKIGHNDIYEAFGSSTCFKKVPWRMLVHMQYVHLSIGEYQGLVEEDIVIRQPRCIAGPERPTYVTLLPALNKSCAILKACRQIHRLRVTIRSVEKKPLSIPTLLRPIKRLRTIKHTVPVIWSRQSDSFVNWKLKESYATYMSTIMSMPKDAKAPRYVGDERNPRQSRKIFEYVGATWRGGDIFYDDSDEFGPDDDFIPTFDHLSSNMAHTYSEGPFFDPADFDH